MDIALRRRLAGVAEVSISQHEQLARVSFVPGTQVFSTAAFRRAVADADVEVITIDARVCGVVDENGTLRIATGEHQPLVQLRGDVRPGASICATGRLDDRVEPYGLEVVSALARSK